MKNLFESRIPKQDNSSGSAKVNLPTGKKASGK
jgi:hypothetical protein